MVASFLNCVHIFNRHFVGHNCRVEEMLYLCTYVHSSCVENIRFFFMQRNKQKRKLRLCPACCWQERCEKGQTETGLVFAPVSCWEQRKNPPFAGSQGSQPLTTSSTMVAA